LQRFGFFCTIVSIERRPIVGYARLLKGDGTLPEMTESRDMAKKSTHGGPRPGSGRPKTTDREDIAVKLNRDVAAMARYVAEVRRITLAQYLSEITDGPVRRDFKAAQATATAEQGKL
jgi:hypothetical protein